MRIEEKHIGKLVERCGVPLRVVRIIDRKEFFGEMLPPFASGGRCSREDNWKLIVEKESKP